MTAAWYLDCDGTLVESTEPYGDLVAGACQSLGLDEETAETLAGAYGEHFFAAFHAFDPEPYRRGMADALAATGLADAVAPDAAALSEALRTAELKAGAVPAGTRETLSRLAERGVRLGVLTNGVTAHQRRKLERHDLFSHFDAYVASYAVGAHKPDPEPFAVARERLPAEEYVYVGDSREDDVEPAREAGFRAVHVDRDAEPEVVTAGSVRAVGELLPPR